MSTPGRFPARVPRAMSVKAALSGGLAEHALDAVPARQSWPWRRAAPLACIAAQLITIADLVGADPIPATWTALLLAVAPVPLALGAAFCPARAARVAAPLAIVALATYATWTPPGWASRGRWPIRPASPRSGSAR